jgi:hypothetical protein
LITQILLPLSLDKQQLFNIINFNFNLLSK